MSRPTYNDEIIESYLLGSLPEAEAARLDELSFTDAGFAHALDAREQELVDSYVNGELEGARLKRFESHYLATPLRRERVNFARTFGIFARGPLPAPEGEDVKSVAQTREGRKGSGFFSILSAPFRSRPRLQWGFASVALALIVVVGWTAFESARRRASQPQSQEIGGSRVEPERGRGEVEERASSAEEFRGSPEVENEEGRNSPRETEPRATSEPNSDSKRRSQPAERRRPSKEGRGGVATFVLMPQMRGVERTAEISIPPGVALASMRLELEPNEHSAYRVALINQSNSRTLWRSGRLKARTTEEGMSLNVSVPAKLLSAGVHVLRVTAAEGEPEIVGDYRFRVVK